LWKLAFRVQCLLVREDGQDLVEYALIVSLIFVAGVAASVKLATAINTLYSNIYASIS
jgi:pilus assembly protein Flp/PilA